MLHLKVAGYNIDADLLGQLKSFLARLESLIPEEDAPLPPEIESFLAEDNLTPETISAAYARISRDPSSIDELRRRARHSVARARKSNQQIVFDYGHASVAEHAVFNIDIAGVSRLAVETIESRRLASFTEKSQRYTALAREYIVPPELKDSPLEDKFKSLCRSLFDEYHRCLPILEKHFRQSGSAGKPELLAREDVRYLLPLASGAQLGMTANARTIEHLIRRTMDHPLEELRNFARALKSGVEQIAPSLIRHLEPENMENVFHPVEAAGGTEGEDIQLINFTEGADETTLAALIFDSEALPWEKALAKARGMDEAEKRGCLGIKLNGLQPHHSMPRAFEAVDFTFQVVLSAAAFGQLKRHRISTQLAHPYSPGLGLTIPDSILSAGLGESFAVYMSRAEALHREIGGILPHCAQYALCNAHRRAVFFKTNAREMHHIARLRMDKHAQWDIRAIAGRMVELARAKAPLTMALACGKDGFEEAMGDFFGD